MAKPSKKPTNKPAKLSLRSALGITDSHNAPNPVQPRDPAKGPTIDDPTQRVQNHNGLARRDPSGARGKRAAVRGQTKRQKMSR